MAKGNLFLGQSRGKLGDIVLYRMKSSPEQMARARNRKPSNPKTNPQLYTRALMATVMQAYSAGKDLFDHSFQGFGVGSPSQSQFMSVNLKRLRAALASDLQRQPSQHVSALLGGPGVKSFVPNEYVISQGSYAQGFFAINDATPQSVLQLTAPSYDDLGLELGNTLADYKAAANLIPGDIYTMVFMGVGPEASPVFEVAAADGDPMGIQLDSLFGFVRMIVRSDTPDKSVADGVLSDLFTFSFSANLAVNGVSDFLATWGTDAREFSPIGSYDFFASPGYTLAAIGIIRSRTDRDLRSDSVMHFVNWDNGLGLAWPWVLDGWLQGAVQVGDSSLILEGGSLDGDSSVPVVPGVVSPSLEQLVTGRYVSGYKFTNAQGANNAPLFQLLKVDGVWRVGLLLESTTLVWCSVGGFILERRIEDNTLDTIRTGLVDYLNRIYGVDGVFAAGTDVTEATAPTLPPAIVVS